MVDLRLDTREGAFAKRRNGAALVPGDLKASLLYQRITAENAAVRMPPKSSHKVLTAEQKEILKQWIEQGAPWTEHWSFSAPVRSALPAVGKMDWVRNPIDHFILVRIEGAGLQPAPEAEKRRLVRRLSLDLTGLPPAPAVVEDFLNDSSPNAYEKLVDRMMASKHWGEHRARYWLDAARYGDTHGIHLDNYREIWPYRDWVIKAFNGNLSFDRFTIEQLAGDLLPNRSLDQQIASGFNRCNITTSEAGSIPEEFEAVYAKDRVDTTGAVWLGLTVGCASCHDHKFDPIKTKDFYSLVAFFRNTTQSAMDGNLADAPPVVVVPKDEDRLRWEQLIGEEQSLESGRQQALAAPGKGFDKWLRSKKRSSLIAPLESSIELLSLAIDSEAKVLTAGMSQDVCLPSGVALGEGFQPGTKALRFGTAAGIELPNISHVSLDKPFSIATWIYVPKKTEEALIVASQTDPSLKDRGWALTAGGFVPTIKLQADDNKQLTLRGTRAQQMKPETWNHVVFTYDGTREHAGLGLFLNGKAVTTARRGELIGKIEGDVSTQAPLRLGSDGKRFFPDGAIADFRVFRRALTGDEASLLFLWPELERARSKPMAQLTAAERDGFHLYFLNAKDKSYQKLTLQLQAAVAGRREIRGRSAVTHVMQEKTDQAPMANVLFRGRYDQPREKVEPNVPVALPAMPASFPRNRLGLAQWLVEPSNPLMARVTVNRFWQELFGTGLVKTAEDFGSQGQAPSHPELLDWLAVDFRESGWDVKRLFKLMVTSAAYRQSALATEDKIKKDPDNRLLSRGPRFRMDGEMVRDNALAASGLLVPTPGGPSVKPSQPDGIWEAVAMHESNTKSYKRDSGDNLYRRSLYTFWKRSAPPASMDTFDAPSREACTVRRERTNTPLQALVTLNDPQFVEAARQLAQRAMKDGAGDLDREINFITERLLVRIFGLNERTITRQAYQDYRAHYREHPEDAKKLLAVGDSQADPALPVPELAALTMVANQVMNLDEVLNK